jgi:hypothetical protein
VLLIEQRYPFIAHGCGAADEYPVVVVDDHHPGILEPGMVLSVEAYMGAVGGRPVPSTKSRSSSPREHPN